MGIGIGVGVGVTDAGPSVSLDSMDDASLSTGGRGVLRGTSSMRDEHGDGGDDDTAVCVSVGLVTSS